MSDTKQILLKEKESKSSVNSDILLNIELSSDEKKFPSDSISSDIDQYKQYIKEKDASNKYRLVFTINPVCTNVLYNHISEIVQTKDDGSVLFYGSNGNTISSDYITYKYGYTNQEQTIVPKTININRYGYTNQEQTIVPKTININREEAIRDTGFSHKKCGNFEYRCGADIFNNHLFRGNEFVIVANKNVGIATEQPYFNTFADIQRDYDGEKLQTIAISGETKETHLYTKSTLKTYKESLRNNLIERDGWFGFINPTGIDVPNFVSGNSINETINKVINNREGCEFIDLYPDRTLFSFLPKKCRIIGSNSYRYEYNWDYCITYPYVNYSANTLVSIVGSNINGIYTEFCNSNGSLLDTDAITALTENTDFDNSGDIVLRTKFVNNIKSGSYVKIHLIADSNTVECYTIPTNIKIKNVGIGGYNEMYYFSVDRDDLRSGLKTLLNKCGGTVSNIRCYVQRVVEGRPCKYYFRIFKRVPNFKDSSINNVNELSKEDINSKCLENFNSSLNKLGFGVNIYGDRMAQILYNDDIDTTGLYDNLGRPLHELYLTLIKANRGNNEWYNGTYSSCTSSTIECSHCFSEVKSGIDMPWPYEEGYADDYNVHKIHGITNASSRTPKFPNTVTALESSITQSGSSINTIMNENGLFFGDIVELDELAVEEYVLETVQHRFNTMQRECLDDEFSCLTHDEIVRDDFDYGNFSVETSEFLPTNYRANLAAEGYYYKAHYRIPIRQFSDIVNEGQHRIVNILTAESGETNGNYTVTATTEQNYYFQVSDKIYVYDSGNTRHIGTITSVGGDNFTEITFTIDLQGIITANLSNFKFYKPNSEMPKTAYDFNDGSGIYRWRDIESFEYINNDSELYDSVFTNGAHYIHENINFFLRRQDPYGDYGLNSYYNDDFPYEFQILEQGGKYKDTSVAEHFEMGGIQIC